MIESLDNPVVFDDVTFSYRGTDVLRGVSFSIEAGAMRALVGDNGAGKSTIARIIVGEATPRSGVARLFGVAPERFEDWARVGYVSQLAPTAIGRFPATVLELVRASQHASMPRFRPASRSFRDAALSALDAVDMVPFSKRLIRELSGGQLQRVRLACALVGAPDLLVLDEPVNGLDKESRAKFYGLVRRAHDEAHAREACRLREERACREHEARHDGTSPKGTAPIHDVDVRCRSKVDYDDRRPIGCPRSHCVGDAVGTDLARVWHGDLDPAVARRIYREHVLLLEDMAEHVVPLSCQHGHDAGNGHVPHVREVEAKHQKVAEEPLVQLVSRVGLVRCHAPLTQELSCLIKEPKRRLRVADVHCKKHAGLQPVRGATCRRQVIKSASVLRLA